MHNSSADKCQCVFPSYSYMVCHCQRVVIVIQSDACKIAKYNLGTNLSKRKYYNDIEHNIDTSI